MTRCGHLFVALLLVTVAAPIAAQDEYLEQISMQFELMDETMAGEGLYPDIDAFTGSINAGDNEEMSVRLQGGVTYQLIGVCDTDCSDVDLTLFDANGRSVAEDVLDDDVPILDVTPGASGTYTIQVAMIVCDAEPCFYGIQIYSEEGSPSSGQTGGAGRAASIDPKQNQGAGQSFEGELRFGDDQLGAGEYFDSYEVQARAGEAITVDLRSDAFDTYLLVVSPSGAQEENDDFGGSTSHSRVSVQAFESGTWEIIATAYEKGMRGTYTVDVEVGGTSGSSAIGTSSAGVRRESGELAVGDPTMSTGEFIDEYQFNGIAGDEVIIDLRASGFDPYLIVMGPNDEQEDNDDYEGDVNRSLVRFELPSSGEYRVGVTSYAADEGGSYDLSIQNGVTGVTASGPTAERGSLEAGDETLTTGEYVDEYTFDGSPGETVRIDLQSGEFDTYVMLIGPGEFREENDDADDDLGHSVIQANLSDAGTYRVLVTSYEPAETGTYQLEIERGAVVATEGQRDVESLQLGRTASGTLEAGDGELDSGEFRDLWVFEGNTGQDVTVEVASGDFDTYLLLVSPNGDVIDENDDAEGRTDLSRVSARLSESGRYRVVATTYAVGETGAYDVTVRGGAEVTAAANTRRNNATRSGGGAGQVYGVFMGISDYGGRANDLSYTADDARRAADAMVEGGGMSRENSIVLTDGEATVANMRQAFQDMGRRVGPDDTFVYFFSGHGARVPRNGPEQSDPDALDETLELYDDGITDNEMSSLLDLIDSNVSLMVLDACFSGGFSKDVISVPGRMGLFSSEEDVTSQVASKFRAGGYLAQFVFDAVGDRLADADDDGAISAIELSQYIHERYRNDVKSGGPDDYVRTGGPQSGFQHFVVDRGSIGPDDVIFR